MTSYNNVFGDESIPPSGQTYRLIPLVAQTQLNWPENYEGPDYLADINDVTGSAANWHITLPPANQQSTGRDFLMRNVGLYAFEVDSFTGVPVAVLQPGDCKYFYSTDNSTQAGAWNVLTFGTGTSQADASQLAGSGLTVIGAQLAQAYPVSVVTATTTVQLSDRATVFTFTSGSALLNLPAALTAGNNFFIMVKNAGTGTVTVQPSGVDRVDNLTSFALAPSESCAVCCTGATWYVVSYGRSTQFQFTKLVKDITGGGTIALTSSEAANKMLQFSGTPTSNTTVVLPSIVGVYYLQNTYTGSATLTIKTATGTGITTAANNVAVLFCDGTNVVSPSYVGTVGGGGGSGGGGIGTTTGFADGSAPSPSVFFSSDTDVGLYHIATNTVGMATNGTEAMRWSANSIGTAYPLAVGSTVPVANTMLDVRGLVVFNGNGTTALPGGLPPGVIFQVATSTGTATRGVIDGYGSGCSPYLVLRTANGSVTSPTAMSMGNNLGQVTFRGRGATLWSSDTALVIARATENWTDTANGSQLLWAVTGNGTTAANVKMILDQNGWLTVGGNYSPAAVLDVNGNVKASGQILGQHIAASGPTYPFVCENTSTAAHGMIQMRYTSSGGVTHDVGYICADDTYAFKVLNQAGNTEIFRVRNSGGVDAYGFNNISDGRLKKDWQPLGNLFERYLQSGLAIKRGAFTYIPDDSRSAGVEAQSFGQVFPEFLKQNDQYLSVSYGSAALLLVLDLMDEFAKLRNKT